MLIRDKPGAMPPWYVERNIGIQHFKNDTSPTDLELAKVVKWVDSGAPEGNPKDLPPPIEIGQNKRWTVGEPDLIVKSDWVTVKAGAPDWWGELPNAPTGLTEDRWVKSVEIREENDVDPGTDGGRKTVGSRYVFHHMIWSVTVPGGAPSVLRSGVEGIPFWLDQFVRRRFMLRAGRRSDREEIPSTSLDGRFRNYAPFSVSPELDTTKSREDTGSRSWVG